MNANLVHQNRRLKARLQSLREAYDALEAYCTHIVAQLPDEALLVLPFPQHLEPNAPPNAPPEDGRVAAVGLGD